jgi:hypothetical protein
LIVPNCWVAFAARLIVAGDPNADPPCRRGQRDVGVLLTVIWTGADSAVAPWLSVARQVNVYAPGWTPDQLDVQL